MKNGTQPQKLLERTRRSGKRILTRRDLMELSKGISHGDRAMAQLVKAGLAEKLSRGVWLVPSGRRPKFDIPRFWSNPDLSDPLTISALVVSKPSIADIARTMLAFGSGPPIQALEELEAAGEISHGVAEQSRRMLNNARIGFAKVAKGRAATRYPGLARAS